MKTLYGAIKSYEKTGKVDRDDLTALMMNSHMRMDDPSLAPIRRHIASLSKEEVSRVLKGEKL